MNKLFLAALTTMFLTGCLEEAATTEGASKLPTQISGPCTNCGEINNWSLLSNTTATIERVDYQTLSYTGLSDSISLFQSKPYSGVEFVAYGEISFQQASSPNITVNFTFSAGNSVRLDFSRAGNSIRYSLMNVVNGVPQPDSVTNQTIGSVASGEFKAMVIFSRTAGVTRMSVEYYLTDFPLTEYATAEPVAEAQVSGAGYMTLRSW